MTSKKPENKKAGPEPERVKIDKPWAKAVGDALKKARPEQGWPEESKPPNKKKPA